MLAVAATGAAGCALTLDFGAPSASHDANGANEFDARPSEIDADRSDGAGRDAGRPLDAAVGDAREQDSGAPTIDAPMSMDTGASVRDATMPDDTGAATVDATTSPDAGSNADSGTDATTTVDAAQSDASTSSMDAGTAVDASPVTCMGVHPIVGPPRTCNPGSCLCMATDACFTVDVVAACCAGTFQCAPPTSDCMGVHPIIGPPRTCTSGSCYCGNPDACFPADRAARCCAIGVACVP